MPAAKPIFTVQVRELVEFALRTGDLGGGGEFTGPGRALAGTLGHQWLQKSRPAGYQKEIRLTHDLEGPDFILRIQGRLDGLFVEGSGVRLEEIKTVGPGWDGNPDPLHWAQAKCYACIYTQTNSLESISVQLTYLHLETREVTELRETFPATALAAFFNETTAIYQRWMQEQFNWQQVRDDSIRRLQFPFARYRPGQRELAVAAYRSLARGERLFLEAPTGIGKTISVLFPAVKALGEGRLERLFYLTATTTGRVVAEKAAADLRRAGLRLRTLTLTAKARLCVRDGHPCDMSTCPLALGYYDRRHAAMRSALAREEITRPALEAVANEHQVCPFELSLDLSEWADAIICDYNYVFDPKVYLRRHFEEGGEYGFLVDEAHNLVDRAREMFSAEINTGEIREVEKLIKKAVPKCAKALRQLATALRKLAEPGDASADTAEDFPADDEPDLFQTPSGKLSSSSQPLAFRDRRDGVHVSRELPESLLPLVETALETAADWLARNEPSDFREPLLELYFALHSFARTAELYDERYATVCRPGRAASVKLFCVDPSHLLRQALERGRAAVLFSATLTPLEYYRRLLGGEDTDTTLQLPSPFPPEHLAVLVQHRIRTQFKDRAQSLPEVVRAIGDFIQGRAGNYLVYLPSYQYLSDVVGEFQTQSPSTQILVQRSGMTDAERDTFLAAFAVEHGRTLVGFAVMGGIFGEGIDLVGERLIGAVIVGVGLPQLDVERDLIADYFQEHGGTGFNYAYVFPGMNRVLQATGRVIRSETDRGAVLLIDSRFRETRYRSLFPAWWQPVAVFRDNDFRSILSRFWQPDQEQGPFDSNDSP